MTIRLVLADDHVLFRQGLRMLLDGENDVEVVGEADDGEQAVEVVVREHPDVILMDVIMPRLDGFTATQILRDKHPDVRVVILSGLEEEAMVVSAVRAGATGFVRKNAPVETLLKTIRGVAEGQVQFSACAAARLFQEVHSPGQPEKLTDREMEVLQRVAQGLANKEIASKLHVSEKTVKSHMSTILGKLGLESRTQAALHAQRMGLVWGEPVSVPFHPLHSVFAGARKNVAA